MYSRGLAQNWSQAAKLSVSSDVLFGASVSISGNTIVVAASSGAYVFTEAGSGWVTTNNPNAELPDSGPVSVSGNTIVVGGEGAAYVFTGSGSTWPQTAELPDSGSVSISGNTIVVGPHVFTRSGPSWTSATELNATFPGVGDEFGDSVAVSGTTIVVGAPGATIGA